MELRRMGVSDRLRRILFNYVLIVVKHQITSYLTLKEIYNFAQLTPVHHNFKIFRALPTSLLLVLITFIGDTSPTFAQTRIANCQPPNAGEYILLVIAPTNNNQRELRSALPPEFKTVTCKYNNQTVVRMGGFKKIDDANRWARYIQNIVGLSATITTRSTQTQPVKPTVTSDRTTPKTPPSLVPSRTAAKPSVVSTLESGEINKIAKQIIVRIDGANQGTGVIVNKQGNIYTVLTNRHVVQVPENYTLRTSDGQTYAFNSSQVKQLQNLDLAVFQFNSDNNYSYAKLGDSSKLTETTPIYIGGWGVKDSFCLERCYRFSEGKIISISPKSKDGYSLIYSNPVKQGMSGGPVLNKDGELVGINGNSFTDPESGVPDFAGIPINEYTKYQNMVTLSQLGDTPRPNTYPPTEPRSTNNLIEVLKADGNFNILIKALKISGVAKVLEGEEPFTIFAPTDAAFAKLPQYAVRDLLKPENKEVLVKILTYHVVPGKVFSRDLDSGNVTSLQGDLITVRVNTQGIMVNVAKVKKADIQGSNGVIHEIDVLILPPSF